MVEVRRDRRGVERLKARRPALAAPWRPEQIVAQRVLDPGPLLGQLVVVDQVVADILGELDTTSPRPVAPRSRREPTRSPRRPPTEHTRGRTPFPTTARACICAALARCPSRTTPGFSDQPTSPFSEGVAWCRPRRANAHGRTRYQRPGLPFTNAITPPGSTIRSSAVRSTSPRVLLLPRAERTFGSAAFRCAETKDTGCRPSRKACSA